MNKQLLLVKLPTPKGIDSSFFGVGYYEGDSFIFHLLNEDSIKTPLRRIPIPEHKGDLKDFIQVIGEIKNIKIPTITRNQ